MLARRSGYASTTCFLAFVSIIAVASLHSGENAHPETELKIKTLSPGRHDGPPGQSLIELIRRKDMSKLISEEMPGRWTLLGYNEQTKTYVLGGLFEIGAWLPVREIQYLAEAEKPKFRPAKINTEEDWYALGTRTSPDGRFVAFVGRDQKHQNMSLFLLDTTKDSHAYLGKPPHAAPQDPPDMSPGSEEQYWDWGGFCCDGHFVMDSRAVWFEGPDVLKVDYGFDPAKTAGAPQRKRIKTWKLPLGSQRRPS